MNSVDRNLTKIADMNVVKNGLDTTANVNMRAYEI